jgi:hypothetical protein
MHQPYHNENCFQFCYMYTVVFAAEYQVLSKGRTMARTATYRTHYRTLVLRNPTLYS